jgi:hypothetical protein
MRSFGVQLNFGRRGPPISLMQPEDLLAKFEH